MKKVIYLNSIWLFLIMLLGVIVGYSIYQNCYTIRAVDVIYYSLRTRMSLPVSTIILWFIFPTVTAFLLLTGVYIKRTGDGLRCAAKRLLIALCPLFLLSIFFFLPLKFYTPLFFSLISGITGFRLFFLIQVETGIMLKLKLTWRFGILLTLALVFLATWRGGYTQIKAYKSLFLHYHDWAIYLTGAKELFDSKDHFISNWKFGLIGGHWMPLFAFTAAYFVGLIRSVAAFFYFNSFIVYSTTLFLLALGKRFHLSVATTLILVVCFVFNPSVSNLSLALYYGFHPIYLFLPMFALFFYFFADKKITGTAFMLVIILMIKETLAFFGIGFGIYMMLKKKIKAGILVVVTCVCYWFFVMLFAMQAYGHGKSYDQNFHFRELGNSHLEIMLSPFLKPDIFLMKLFAVHNLYFISLMLLPFFIITLSNPLLLVADTIVLVFVCIQNGNEVQNIALWYQTEMIALVTINCIVCINQIKSGRNKRWFAFYSFGLPTANRQVLIRSCLASVVITTFMGYYFFGKSIYWGKYSFGPIEKLPDYTLAIKKIKEIVPPNCSAMITPRVATHFCLSNKLAEINPEVFKQDYIVLDLAENGIPFRDLECLRRKLIRSNAYHPVLWFNYLAHDFVVYQKGQLPVNYTFIQKKPGNYSSIGYPLKTPNKDFECRVLPETSESKIYFFFRPVKKLNYDVNLEIILNNGSKSWYVNTVFGHGIYPAYMMTPEEYFILSVKYPSDWQKLDSAHLKIVKRRESDF